MQFEEKIIGSLYLLRLQGEFHPHDVETLHMVFEKALEENKRIVLELGFSKPASSTIVAPLLKLAGSIHATGQTLVVARATGNLRFLLTMLNKQHWFEFHEAINAIVLEETNKPTQDTTLVIDEEVSSEAKPVIYQIPDISDFNLD